MEIGKQFDHLREVFHGASGGRGGGLSAINGGINFLKKPGEPLRFDPEHHPDSQAIVINDNEDTPATSIRRVRSNRDAVPVSPETKRVGSLAELAKQIILGKAQEPGTTRVRVDSVRRTGKGTQKGKIGQLISRGVVADGQIGWRVMHSSELNNEGPLKHITMPGWGRAAIREGENDRFGQGEEARRQELVDKRLGQLGGGVHWSEIGGKDTRSDWEDVKKAAADAKREGLTPWKDPEDITAGEPGREDDNSFKWMQHHKDYKDHAFEMEYGSGEGPDWFKSTGRGSIKSERGSRGSTMFSSTWGRAQSPSFARPPEHIGGSYHLVAVDLSGLPFKSLRKPDSGEDTPAGSHHDIPFDVGLGLGITGKIPHSRILHVINLDHEGKPDFENGWTHDGTTGKQFGAGI